MKPETEQLESALKRIIVGVFVAMVVVSWLQKPASTTAPSRPSRTLTGYGIVIPDAVRACNQIDGCVTFRGGMRVIVDGHANGSYLIRRIATEPSYWIPDRSLRLERAP